MLMLMLMLMPVSPILRATEQLRRSFIKIFNFPHSCDSHDGGNTCHECLSTTR